jgi:hypothetical protein
VLVERIEAAVETQEAAAYAALLAAFLSFVALEFRMLRAEQAIWGGQVQR